MNHIELVKQQIQLCRTHIKKLDAALIKAVKRNDQEFMKNINDSLDFWEKQHQEWYDELEVCK